MYGLPSARLPAAVIQERAQSQMGYKQSVPIEPVARQVGNNASVAVNAKVKRTSAQEYAAGLVVNDHKMLSTP
jgi:hypothetical protein